MPSPLVYFSMPTLVPLPGGALVSGQEGDKDSSKTGAWPPEMGDADERAHEPHDGLAPCGRTAAIRRALENVCIYGEWLAGASVRGTPAKSGESNYVVLVLT